jgi:hypothetical protein
MSRIRAGTGSTPSSGGDVTGIPPTTIDAIARWNDTTGTTIKNSPGTLVQDSGAIEMQAALQDRQILNDVIVPNHYTMLQTDVFLISGDIILDGDSTLLLL